MFYEFVCFWLASRDNSQVDSLVPEDCHSQLSLFNSAINCH
jgi:hypothetical protein